MLGLTTLLSTSVCQSPCVDDPEARMHWELDLSGPGGTDESFAKFKEQSEPGLKLPLC